MSRRTVHPDVLNFLIREAAARQSSCREAYCGDVVEQPDDADGCNWRLSRVQGSHCGECLADILPFIRDLQARFDIGFDEAASRSLDLPQFLPVDRPRPR